MIKNRMFLVTLLLMLLGFFMIQLAACEVMGLIYRYDLKKEILFYASISIVVMLLWLLSLIAFYKFSLSVQKEKMNQQADLLQQEESLKLIQTLQSQRHDFRNQLQVIRVLAQFDRNEDIIKYVDEYVSITDVSVSLQARIENAVISAMFIVFLTEAQARGIELLIDSDIDFSKFPHSPAKVTSLLGNLIRNAIEILDLTTNSKRTIQVTMWETVDNYSFLVWNNGPVIPDEIRGKIFTPGFSTKKSSGLGLCIVKKMVEELSGKISFESNLEYGTEFKVIIPRLTQNQNIKLG
ncbi:MAG TPA: ATP-binding protein [Bacillota bacterium]|jgi:two-component system sensor histidine kinase AgrC|nr:ATP-binding protein [Bacillota bacterium]